MAKLKIRGGLLALVLALTSALPAQDTPPPPRRIHLILKDGSYQLVLQYQVKGSTVRYTSAERDNAIEEIPLRLVDLDATHAWEAAHTLGAAQQGRPPALDPELLKEEQERLSLTPEVAPSLRLPLRESVLALDTYRDTPELVPLVQSDGDLSHTTSHNILKSILNPHASPHTLVQLRGEKSLVQLHIDRPAIYLRIGDLDEAPTGGTPFTVQTGAAGSTSQPKTIVPDTSAYVILRADVRTDARLLMSFRIDRDGSQTRDQDVIDTNVETLPGNHWLRITPTQPLLFGEYALVEVLSGKQINLAVWDFGVHPTEPENRDALKPEVKRPFALERRGREQTQP